METAIVVGVGLPRVGLAGLLVGAAVGMGAGGGELPGVVTQ